MDFLIIVLGIALAFLIAYLNDKLQRVVDEDYYFEGEEILDDDVDFDG